ncbi:MULTISPECIES: response regulator [unclassified Motilimonas]|uniref:response regulator n=1 Tax=Motilimonas TaxID=1914248 RepID=UPI001E418E32|nr:MULTISPECIES: response regulator [unclassified Motilimonas]MCE0556638.1 response regulator [Motilimonas sp. E26]MDO6524795.1 response regulator [Motilimonas sp. 1_MG-2023]
MYRLLLIDDDRELAALLKEFLSLEGFETELAHDGEAGLEKALRQSYDLILLDVMMPKLNGFDTLKQLRQTSQQPVLMLTAKGEEIDRVLGLEMGADDYLAKPFSDRELVARIKAILRRTANKAPEPSSQLNATCISHLDIEVYPGKQTAICQQQNIDLTGTEFLLLQEFIEHPGQVISKADLSERVLGKKLMPFDRSIDMHLSNLRRKLPERLDGQDRVRTLRGRGYIWLEGGEA